MGSTQGTDQLDPFDTGCEDPTLRNLAISAPLLENKPKPVKLRLIHTMETARGYTFIIHPDPGQDITGS